MRDHLQHPNEEAALMNMVNNGSFHKIIEVFDKAYARLTDMATLPLYNFPITQETAPRVHKLYRKAMERLGITKAYPLYATMGYTLTAKTIGIEKDCAILINSACMAEMTDEQLTALLGQQLGHILFGHVKYMSAFQALGDIVQMMPKFMNLAVDTVKFLFQDWIQYANFTSDRAAAVACGTTDAVVENLIRGMGGVPESKELHFPPSFFADLDIPAQSELGAVGKAVFQATMSQAEFPLGLLRIQELQRWARSEDCRKHEPQIHYDHLASLEDKPSQDKMVALHVSARKEDPKAMGELGSCYLYGKNGVSQNLSYGVQMLRQAASLGDGPSQLLLSRMLLDGSILGKNREAAQLLLEMAVARKLPQAAALYGKEFSPLPQIPAVTLQALRKRHIGAHPDRTHYEATDPDNRAKLGQVLWIADSQEVVAWEQYMEGAITVAVATGGIYLCQKPALPRRVSWESLSKGDKRLLWEKETMMMRVTLDGETVRCMEPEAFERSIFGLISDIRDAMKK